MKSVMVWMVFLAAAGCLAQSPSSGPAGPTTQVGGANAPEPSAPPKLAVKTTEIAVGDRFTVRVPNGVYEWRQGADAYAVPGPIVAFRGSDGVWRGHSYLETDRRVAQLQAGPEGEEGGYELRYTFDDDSTYTVRLRPEADRLRIEEHSELGPRSLWVFDAYYDWQPASGFAIDREVENHAFVYLPCHYDKPEVVIKPVGEAEAHPPMGVAVLSDDPRQRDVAGFHVRELDEGMNVTLWQRRQLPGKPASRHFLGPETKSDSTPNPRTAPLLGDSLYEGHVTIEFGLDGGERSMVFTVMDKGPEKGDIPAKFKQAVATDE